MATEIDVRIDRSSPVPLYHQLAEQLAAAIDDGALHTGDAFENEVAMGQRLGLSRPTVRRAIAELAARGLLVRRRGVGTTVANRTVHRKAELTSLWDDLTRAGAHPTTTVLSLEVVQDERVAAMLDLPADSELLAVVRLRLSDGEPLAVLRNWLPPAHLDITRDDLEAEGLYAVLRRRGARPVVARQGISARPPSPSERRHLRMRGNEPVLTMTRSAFDEVGHPVEYGDHCYRASTYTIEVMVDER